MKHLKWINSLGIAWLLTSSALAEPAKTLIEEQQKTPEITVSETTEVSAASAGLVTPAEAGLPEALWKDMGAAEWLALNHDITHGIQSASLRSLVIRSLSVNADMPDSKTDLLVERAETLITLGQLSLAEKLLAQVPQGYRTTRHTELNYLFKVLKQVSTKEICAEAEGHLAEKPSAFWQRWVILCQAKAGETDKAQLGLDLLNEQSEYSEFFQKIAQGMLYKKPISALPEIVFIEQAAWLLFSGQQQYLKALKNPPLALLDHLNATAENSTASWKENIKRYGIGQSSLQAPLTSSYTPELKYLSLSSAPTPKNQRLAFLAYGLRKALHLPVSLEVEENLLPAYYREEQIITSPSWRQGVTEAAKSGQSGKLVLLLGAMLNNALNNYSPADIATAVAALNECGLVADANALAKEAMDSTLALTKK